MLSPTSEHYLVLPTKSTPTRDCDRDVLGMHEAGTRTSVSRLLDVPRGRGRGPHRQEREASDATTEGLPRRLAQDAARARARSTTSPFRAKGLKQTMAAPAPPQDRVQRAARERTRRSTNCHCTTRTHEGRVNFDAAEAMGIEPESPRRSWRRGKALVSL